MWLPMAWMRWVLPRPTPPYTKSGLYEVGWSATCRPAARASWLAFPDTNEPKLNDGLRLVESDRRGAAGTAGPAAATGAAGTFATADISDLSTGTGGAGRGMADAWAVA